MSRFFTATLAGGLVVMAACRDTSVTSPTRATAIADWRAANAASAESCTPMTLAQLYALSDSVFADGGPNSNAVKSKIDQIDKAKKKGDTQKTKDAAFNANRLVFQKFKGPQPLAGTNAQVARLISGIFCFAGINITITDPANSNIIDPSSTTQVVKSQDSTAGTKLPPGSIAEPTVLEFTKVPNTYPTPGAGPLNTRLDQYPGFYLIQASNASGSNPAAPITVAICADASVPASIRGRLRLGHEKSNGFEIAPPADASFLSCPAPTNLGFLPGWASKALSALMPRTLYAAIASNREEFVGGVGGTASEFSAFDPVDPFLEFSAVGGVGGTASEFTTRPTRKTGLTPQASAAPAGDLASVIATPGAMANTLSAGVCTAVEAPWNSELEPQCRPRLELRTRLGTPLRDVPLTWSVTAGGGTIAAGVPGTTTCTGAFAASITFNTSADSGRSGICWKMGPTLGTNTVTVTPGIGGDVPPGVTYVPAIPTFNATAIKRTPVATATGASVTYDGLDHPGSGTCSEGLTPALAYSSGVVPNDVGVDTLTVTCSDGDVLYNTVTASATITVTALRVAGVGANAGNRAADTVFATGDLPGTMTRLTVAQFNGLSPDSLRKLFDVIIVTWSSSNLLNVDWETRLLPYLQLGGGVIYEDPNNVGDLAAVIGAAVVNVGGAVPTAISVAAVAGLTDGITSLFDNNHIWFTTFAAWSPSLTPFLTWTASPYAGEAVGLYGRFGAGCIVLTGPDQDYHSERGDNQYKLLINEIKFVRSCP